MSKYATGMPNGRPMSFKDKTGAVPSRDIEDCPQPPILGEDGLGFWFHTWMSGNHLSPSHDYLRVQMLAETYDEMSQLRRMLSTGMIERFYTHSNGSKANHPAWNQMNELRKQMAAQLSQLGFGPAERIKMSIDGDVGEAIKVVVKLQEDFIEMQKSVGFIQEVDDDEDEDGIDSEEEVEEDE